MKPNELISPSNFLDSSGIYLILCIPSNKGYIGQSSNIKRRWIHHKSQLRNNRHCNVHLQNSYNLYGKNSISFFILENCSKNLAGREAFWINQIDEELRLNIGLVRNAVERSLEWKSKLSSLFKGKPRSEETKEKIRRTKAANKYIYTDEIKLKMSLAQKGKKLSREQIDKLSKRMKGNTIMLGRKHSEETKKKMKEAKR